MQVSTASPLVLPPSHKFGSWFGHVRNLGSRDFALRALGSTWFLLLGILAVHAGLTERVTTQMEGSLAGGWPKLLSYFGIGLFYFTLWLLILIRPVPINRASGIFPNAMAFVGTYAPWLIGLFPRQELSSAGYIIAATLILGGNLLTLTVLWHLGRSFSIVPQARRLVTTGPYAVVRHPLYLSEEMMVIGTALLYLSPLMVALVVLHFCVQIRRMVYEEAVLVGAFPDYRTYAARTWRVLPRVW